MIVYAVLKRPNVISNCVVRLCECSAYVTGSKYEICSESDGCVCRLEGEH